jgi:O-antigen/teichoic acid export membrane protein
LPADRINTGDPSPSQESPRVRGRYAWGLIDQTLSSTTNFGLVLLAGRWLGPARLGIIAVGFAAFILCLVLYRALITSPLVVVSGRLVSHSLTTATQMGVAVGVLAAAFASISLVLIGFLVPGDIGRGLLLFGPWVGPALVQDLWRLILFRDSRGRSAVLNDALWAVGMALTLPVAWRLRTEWAVVACWGVGATLGAVFGVFQTGSRMRSLRIAYRWWRGNLWPLGRWFAMDRAALNIGTQGSIFLLASFLGSRDIGGLRAVQSIFAPLSLLGPAIVLPGLPVIVRILPTSSRQAWVLGLRLGAIVTGLALAYMAVVGAARARLLDLAFGGSFRSFGSLVLPVAVAQVFVAAGVGTGLLLEAARSVRALLVSRASGTVLSLPAVWLLGHEAGIVGGAWGLAIGAALTTLLYFVFSWPLRRGRASPADMENSVPPGIEGVP